jgi:hypothetical protein
VVCVSSQVPIPSDCYGGNQMSWESPKYRREQVNKAGRALANAAPDEVPDEALDVISNWRLCHSWPLNTFKLWLLGKALHIDAGSLVAQRLKRLSSIALKLRRFPEMKLSQMQDIGGCRAIVATAADVDKLVERYKKSDLKHKLVHEDDYIRSPKTSGYRGYHLVYRYNSDKSTTYNDLKVEVQLRSSLQHAWATAVETVGAFTEQALKSSHGPQEWLRFFELMSAELASRERTAAVPNTPTNRRELRLELREYEAKLGVINRLELYAASIHLPETAGEMKDAKLFLLELDPNAMQLRVTGYKARELERASADYLRVERRALAGGRDAVLVSVDSFRALKKAYPNYYMDTHKFIQALKEAIRVFRPTPPRDPRQEELDFNLSTGV